MRNTDLRLEVFERRKKKSQGAPPFQGPTPVAAMGVKPQSGDCPRDLMMSLDSAVNTCDAMLRSKRGH
jgi:hypothetical protein